MSIKSRCILIKMSEVEKVIISEPAAPSSSTIESAVNETVNESVAPSGLEAQETPDVNDTELEQTTLDMSKPVLQEVSALTEYVDTSATRISESTATALDILDKNFMFPPDYFKVVERSMPVGKITLNNNNPTQWPIARLDLANKLLGFNAITDKLNYVNFIRYNLEVQIKVLATNYHYGQLMFVWRPSYGPFVIGENNWNTSTNVWYETVFNRGNIEDGTMKTCLGPYDNVFTASQLDHHILPVTAGGNLTIKLPWTLNKQYVNTSQMMLPQNHIGYLDVYQLTPIAPTDIDRPIIQIFARFVDIVGFGYRALSDPCIKTENQIARRVYLYGDGTNNWDRFLNAVWPDGFLWYAAHSIQMSKSDMSLVDPFTLESAVDYGALPWYDIDPKSKVKTPPPKHKFGLKFQKSLEKKEKTVDAAAQTIEVAESGEITRQQRGGALYSTFNAAVSTANTVASWVGDALAFFGLSKPPMKGVPSRFVNMAPPMSNAVGPDFCQSNGINPESLVLNKRSDHSEMVLIENLGKCETFIGWTVFNVDSSNELRGWVAPQLGRAFGVDKIGAQFWYRTPASMLCERFKLWRSNVKYKLHFSSSSFVSARFSITVEYSWNRNDAERIGIVPTQVVEVKGDMTVEGEIPYLKDSPWMTKGDSVAYLRVALLDDAVSWNASKGTPIYMSLWFSYPGLQVAFPSQEIEGGVPWSAFGAEDQKPRLTAPTTYAIEGGPVQNGSKSLYAAYNDQEVPESGKLPGTTSESGSKQYGMNDIVTSLYHLAKRFNPGYGRYLMPFAPSVMWMKRTDKEKRILVTYSPNNSHMACCFRWVRGSYDIVNPGSHVLLDQIKRFEPGVVSDVDNALCLLNKGKPKVEKNLFRFAMTNNHSFKSGQNVVAVRSPFHSQFPFISGPFVWMRSSRKDVKFVNTWFPMYGFLGEEMQFTESDGLDQPNQYMPYYEFAYGDDLCYNQWMGTPMAVQVRNSGDGFFPDMPHGENAVSVESTVMSTPEATQNVVTSELTKTVTQST